MTPSRLVLLHNGIANDDQPICSLIKQEQLNIHCLCGFSTCLRLMIFFLVKQKPWIHQIMDANCHNSTKQIPVWFASIRVYNYKPDRHSIHAWDNWDSQASKEPATLIFHHNKLSKHSAYWFSAFKYILHQIFNAIIKLRQLARIKIQIEEDNKALGRAT